MDQQPTGDSTALQNETPESLLDAIRNHPEWDDRRRDEILDQLIARFPSDRIVRAVVPRLQLLGRADGECLLRLVEANAAPDLLASLADAILAQPDLAPERAWEALAILDAEELLDSYPELSERWDELNEMLGGDGEDPLEVLAEQLEGDPAEAWLALEGLTAVEPEVRVEIVNGLREAPIGPGIIGFLRLLCFTLDLETRAAALDTLEYFGNDDSRLVDAWTSIAEDHPDPDVGARARRWLANRSTPHARAEEGPARVAPRLVRSLVTALDGHGRGSVLLSSRAGTSRVIAAFLCDVRTGIPEVYGQVCEDQAEADRVFDEIADQADCDVVADAHELALSLLAGSLLLCGPSTPPALRYWIEQSVGPAFRACPIPPPFPGWDPASLPFREVADRAEGVLSSCPTWLDESALTYEIAEELLLRQGDVPPDPVRDVGAYRFLFERRLLGQLDLYRRMLLWMASFWQASGDHELGRSALGLAWQLLDAQHTVPSHPFSVILTTRSLSAAGANVRKGIDPRRGNMGNSAKPR